MQKLQMLPFKTIAEKNIFDIYIDVTYCNDQLL